MSAVLSTYYGIRSSSTEVRSTSYVYCTLFTLRGKLHTTEYASRSFTFNLGTLFGGVRDSFEFFYIENHILYDVPIWLYIANSLDPISHDRSIPRLFSRFRWVLHYSLDRHELDLGGSRAFNRLTFNFICPFFWTRTGFSFFVRKINMHYLI